jgi:hypothetical protein
MNDLITQLNVLAAGIELTVIVAGTLFTIVGIKLIIDLLKGDK